MIYLHCGWLKTGTTSLQAALDRRHDELEAAGVVNANRWRVLSRRLNGPEADIAIDEFMRYVDSHAGADVLLSCETFMNMLVLDHHQENFLRFIEALHAGSPVACVWTLRRWDEVMRSYYLWQLSYGLDPPSFFEFLDRLPAMDGLFRGLRRVDEATGGNSAYVKYDPAGSHNVEILRLVGIPAPIADEIAREIRETPRRNVAMTYKEAIALLNAAELSARAGVDLDKATLRKAFARGDFRFEDDRPCELIDWPERQAMHEEMLELARKVGFEPYLRFFERDAIEEPSRAVGAEPDAIGDEDLDRLVSYLRNPKWG